MLLLTVISLSFLKCTHNLEVPSFFVTVTIGDWYAEYEGLITFQHFLHFLLNNFPLFWWIIIWLLSSELITNYYYMMLMFCVGFSMNKSLYSINIDFNSAGASRCFYHILLTT